MGKQAAFGLLAVLVTGALWMTPDSARSQDSGTGNGEPSVGFSHPYSDVHPATVTDRLLWTGISLINPQSKKKPVFIYGYELSKLDEETVAELLSEAAASNIKIAILKPSSKGGGTYEGKAVHIPNGLPEPDLGALGDNTAWRASSGRLVALSRPLHGFSGKAEEREFVAKPGFWPSVAPEP